jgi:uncharacterized protein YbaR (Trm112 family)
MHLLLTDRLACVRCGPEFGLILMAEELRDRRVIRGSLGCANCRERYPVEEGFADLRSPPRERERAELPEAPDDPEEAVRLAALLGLTEGSGRILLTGEAVARAARLAGMVDGVEVVALHAGMRRVTEEAGVSRISAAGRLPFFDGSFRGIVLTAPGVSGWLDEAVRTLAPGGRLLVRSPREGAARALEAAGLELLLEADAAVVGVREGLSR